MLHFHVQDSADARISLPHVTRSTTSSLCIRTWSCHTCRHDMCRSFFPEPGRDLPSGNTSMESGEIVSYLYCRSEVAFTHLVAPRVRDVFQSPNLRLQMTPRLDTPSLYLYIDNRTTFPRFNSRLEVGGTKFRTTPLPSVCFITHVRQTP